MGSYRPSKRELAFLLEGQPQFSSSSIGRTRASNANNGVFDKGLLHLKESGLNGSLVQNLCNGVSETVKNKRLKRNLATPMCENEILIEQGSLITGLGIDRGLNTENPMVIEDGEVQNKPVRRFTPSLLSEPKAEALEDSPIGIDSSGTNVVGVSNKHRRRFTRSLLKSGVEPLDKPPLDIDSSSMNEAPAIEVDDEKKRKGSSGRFSRSLLKPKVEALNNSQLGIDDGKREAILNVDEVETDEQNTLRTWRKNMELKMSKKIEPNRIPHTVKELLETGLLEGISVTYCFPKKVSRLQGKIKDLGILCSCSSCKGLHVVSPSKFELHATRVYRQMATYIYLDNGRSLRDVLTACKESSLDTLECTIQNEIGSLPLKKPIIFEKCSGELPPGCAKVNSLSISCMESEESKASVRCTSGSKCRSIKVTGVSKSPKSTSLNISAQEKSQWRITKKNWGLNKLVFEEGGLPDGTELGYYARGKKLLEGYKKGFGIFCLCCNSEVSASTFEAHAGWASRKKPYTNIYTSNGVSLHELAISLSKDRKYFPSDSDDICIICCDGGDLLLCDGCPRAFHKECTSLTTVPRGKWYCSYCQTTFQKERFLENNANAVAAGRVSGVDPIKQITQRCIRIVKNADAEVSTCVLCRGNDFTKCSNGPRTIILCDQCEMEYHISCLKDRKIADLKDIPKGKWFCCMDCKRIHSTLQNLLVRGAEKLPGSLLIVVQKKQGSGCSIDVDVRWRLLSGRYASPDVRSLLAKAVDIFHECFDPIVDPTTGQDLIPPMIYGRNVRDQEFAGMYCAVLLVNSCVVSAGILRVFGREAAELPLVATCKKNQGKGYFQILFSCIKKLLTFLNVKSIVLPAAHEAESLWIKKMDFKKIPPLQLSELRKNCWQMITFQGTSMLQKMVPESRTVSAWLE